MEQVAWPVHELAQGTVGGRRGIGGTVPGEPDSRAEVPVAVPALPAACARYRRVDSDPLPALRPFGDHSGGLVAED
jgi:hypothetical protein